jgi:hypothetical protein
MDRRKLIGTIAGLGIGGYVIYQLLKPKPIEEKKPQPTPEELRRECRARVAIICSQAGGALRDRCLENEVSIASYECVDTIYQCCLSMAQPTAPAPTQPPEAPQPRETIIGIAGGAVVTPTPTPSPAPTPTPQPPEPQPYQPPPELPLEVLQPGCPASMPEGPYNSPLPETIEESITTINPYGKQITAKIIKKCYCVPLGPSDKPYYCCACPQVLCPQGYYPSDVSDGREESFFVYPGLWCNKL